MKSVLLPIGSIAGTACFYCLLLSLLASCEEAPYELMPKDKVRIDTLYNREIDVLAPYLDSICESKQKQLVGAAVDSIMEIRLKERESLLER